MNRISALKQLVLWTLFGVLNLIGPQALAQIKFKGEVRVIGSDVFVKDEYSNNRYSLYSHETDIKAQISRLSTGDYITGTASEVVEPRLIVEGIDFVGLKKILGYWQSRRNVFNFKDFTMLAIWNVGHSRGSTFNNQHYTYSITPGVGADWQIFIADENEVRLCSLDFLENAAMITIFDPNTGEKKETIRLKKLQKISKP